MTFKPGQGGRMKGARNKLAKAFLDDLIEEWSLGGREALRIARLEDPVRFSIMVASLLPKEMTLEVGPLQELPDDRLVEYIEFTERQLAGRVERIEGRASETADGGQTPVLQTVQSSEEIP
jgi:hypothetical protein